MQPMLTDEWAAAIPAPRQALARSFAHPLSTILFAVFAAALSFFTFRSTVAAVWHAGAFFDTDDAMRLVQVRTLLHGQAWFDMTAKAMDPPHGVFLHWSRIVDIPVAALIRLFGLFTDETTAERLARLAFPFALLVGLYLGMARLGNLLLGPAARIPAIAGTLLSGNGIIQFVPGRIDHHAPQIVVLVVMLGAALAALDPGKARLAALAGLLAALSLAISLENLPFIACLSATLAMIWVWHGAPMDRMLAAYAAGLCIGLPLFFVATVGPSRYALPVCDAFGAAHLGAGLIGALGCGAAALATSKLRTRRLRFVAAVTVAALAAGFVALVYPACLHDPFAAVDPLVREIWMSNVEEALPFRRLLRQEFAAAWTSIVPVVMGLVACLFAAWRMTGRLRLQFLILASIVAVGLALAFWQVRVFTSVTAIALCGGLYVAVSAQKWCLRQGRENLASLSLLLLFPFTAAAVGAALPAFSKAPIGGAVAEKGASFDDCLAPRAFAPLRTLTPGSVVGPVDAGSYLLAHTDLSVFAAAYHRNNDGTRFAFDLMSAPPSEARRMAAQRGVAYVMTCPGLGETDLLANRHPDGLAAALRAGRPPVWLGRVPLEGTPFRVFRVLPDKAP